MLEGFEDYLVTKVALNKKYVSYYLTWVSNCYSFLEEPDNSILTPDQVQSYLKHISKTREDWQVKQAETALRHYSYYLSSEAGRVRADVQDRQPSDHDLWMDLEKKVRDQLRLRHRTYSTEKTYIGWLRSFRGFVGSSATPPELSVNHMQNFLSSLAVDRRVSPSTQNQALNALIFFYRHALEKEPGPAEIRAVRANPKRHLPIVLTIRETHSQAQFCNASA